MLLYYYEYHTYHNFKIYVFLYIYIKLMNGYYNIKQNNLHITILYFTKGLKSVYYI